MNAAPAGAYAGASRSPIIWALLCSRCAGYASQEIPGAIGQCQGCGAWAAEVHRFAAVLKTDEPCHCAPAHPRVTGDLPASAGRWAWTLTPPAEVIPHA